MLASKPIGRVLRRPSVLSHFSTACTSLTIGQRVNYRPSMGTGCTLSATVTGLEVVSALGERYGTEQTSVSMDQLNSGKVVIYLSSGEWIFSSCLVLTGC